MPPALRPDDHYVLRKLGTELLPWMIVGRRVDRQWFVRVATLYAYIGDFGAMLAGLGIGTPVAAMLTGSVEGGQSALETLRTVLPGFWFWIGVAGLGLWVFMRLVIQREDAVSRAALARDCAFGMRALYIELWQSLRAENPMPKIAEIQKSVDEKVQSAMTSKVWPYDPLPPNQDIEKELVSAINEIRGQFMASWAKPPAGVIQ